MPGDDGLACADGAAALQAGEWLAVHGTGGIGLSALILGRALGARVVVVDVVPERLAHALTLGAEAAVDARDGDVAARIVEITGGGAHVSVEALGIAATVNASIECLRPLGRHVQIGLPTGHMARMEINLNAVYMKQLALFGSRGMPSWRYPSLLTLIETGRVDVAPIVARHGAPVGSERRTARLQRADAAGRGGDRRFRGVAAGGRTGGGPSPAPPGYFVNGECSEGGGGLRHWKACLRLR